MRMFSTVGFVVIAFIAGFVATLVFNQSAGFLLTKLGLAPRGFAPWALDPVPPWGVPAIISKAFWGGLWAIPLGLVLRSTRGGAYWASWVLLGAVLPSLVGIFIVPPLKGSPIPDFASRFPFGATVNAAWGFGTAFILWLADAASRRSAARPKSERAS